MQAIKQSGLTYQKIPKGILGCSEIFDFRHYEKHNLLLNANLSEIWRGDRIR